MCAILVPNFFGNFEKPTIQLVKQLFTSILVDGYTKNFGKAVFINRTTRWTVQMLTRIMQKLIIASQLFE